jgi:hypothetical protein
MHFRELQVEEEEIVVPEKHTAPVNNLFMIDESAEYFEALHWVFTAYCVTDLYLLPASLG